MPDFKNKKVLIVGLGRSGLAALRVLSKLGAEVSVQDAKTEDKLSEEVRAALNAAKAECFLGCVPDKQFDLLVLSPGVSPELGFIVEQKKNGAEIIGELELAYRLSRCSFVAITGTNGKTTTTALVGEIFKLSGRDSYTVGNIGIPVVDAAADAEKDAWMVTEVSSFQLETTSTFRPKVSALLNLTPDHLDRHHTMEGYGAAKAKIYANQSADEYFVVNRDDVEGYKWASKCPATVVPFSRKEQLEFGVFVKDGKLVVRDAAGKMTEFCGAEELRIPGAHNLENALAAAAVSYFAGIDPETISRGLKTFKGVEHRIEFTDEINGVRFVNDSKGTNPDAAIKAIEAMKGGIVLIAGGYDKGSEYDAFIAAFGNKVKAVMLLGATAPKIRDAMEKAGLHNYLMLNNMEECVRHGFESAQQGDTVLLSPACASWDMYSCFEERGEHFKKCVKELKLASRK